MGTQKTGVRSRNGDGYGWRCPKCGLFVDTSEELEAHFAAHPACGDFARSAAHMALHYGVEICVRCEAAILGVAVLTKANGFVHDACLTAAERAEMEAESRQILSEIETANTDPRLIGMPELGRKMRAGRPRSQRATEVAG